MPNFAEQTDPTLTPQKMKIILMYLVVLCMSVELNLSQEVTPPPQREATKTFDNR